MKHIAIAGIAALLLTSCAAGPGKGDIEKALAAYVQQGTGFMPAFKTLDIGKCAKDEGSAGYACSIDAEVELTVASSGRKTNEHMTGTFVFDKLGDGWKVVSSR